jgi:hypothetical protein
MKISTKIKIYSISSWILIILTIFLALYEQLRIGKFSSLTILSFLTDILLQPYFWVALILRWRIKVNQRLLKSKNTQ